MERIIFGFCIGILTTCTGLLLALAVKLDVYHTLLVFFGLVLGITLTGLCLTLTGCEPNGCARQSDCPAGLICDETLHCSSTGDAAVTDDAGTIDGGGGRQDLTSLPTGVCWKLAHDAYQACLPENVDSTNRAMTLACVDSLAITASASDATKARLHELARCFLTDCGPVGKGVLGSGDFQNPCKACEPSRLACLND